MKYFVNEIQNGTSTTYAFDSLAEAQSKYHNILSYAAVSEIGKHGAILYNNNCVMIESRVYLHGNEEPNMA